MANSRVKRLYRALSRVSSKACACKKCECGAVHEHAKGCKLQRALDRVHKAYDEAEEREAMAGAAGLVQVLIAAKAASHV